MDAAVVLETFFDANQNLRGKTIMRGIDGRTDDRGEAGINEHLAADHNKDPLFSGVSGCGVSDAIELTALHGIT
jgi:hypothetical protein